MKTPAWQQLRKLPPEKNVERYLDGKKCGRVEEDRRVLDMEGWATGVGGHPGADNPVRGVAVGTPAGPGVISPRPVYVRTPSDPGNWSPDYNKSLLDTTDGQKFYRRRAADIRDDLQAAMRNARRTFSARLDALIEDHGRSEAT